MRPEEAVDPPEQGFAPPAEFDGFRVVRQLGRGAMGQVYLGHDDVLDRPVALKFLAAADPKVAARDRFLVEARAIARLQHPNVVGIYRIGEVLDRPYIAYELIAGQSLDKLARPVPWQRALELALGVARGLSAAHRRDVLHRDIKPANVMLADTGEIKLLDFGLAKLLDGTASPPEGARSIDVTGLELVETRLGAASPGGLADGATLEAGETGVRALGDGTSLTDTGAILGTPLYMAPELWRGEVATAQSDVYAFGLLLYELLSGRLPHEGLRPAEIAYAVQTRAPPPIRSLCPNLPLALAAVVDRCIRPRRDERFQTAEEARDALEAIRALYQPFVAQPEVPLTGADDALLIIASFARMAPHADAFGARVYERLFAQSPHLRALFPTDLTAQRRKLFGALVVIVDNVRRPDRLLPLLDDLGRRHAAYGVEPEHFDAVGAALLGALADFDDRFGEDTARAWTHGYASFAQAMQRGLADERATLSPSAREAPPVLAREQPATRYARSGDVNLAYQIVGDGPLDVIVVPGGLTHLEVSWEWPPLARFLHELASLGRLITLDGRGTGLSDPAAPGALLEDRMGDLRAVLDAAGAERAVIIGLGQGAAACALFAATHPERTRALILYGGNARVTAGDGYPHGAPPERHDEARARIRASWGEPLFLETLAPSQVQNEAFRSWWARYLRMAVSPGAAIAHQKAGAAIDVRAILPAIRVPTLVLHRTGDLAVPIAAARYLAEHLPDAQLVELPGSDHLPFVGDTGALVDAVRGFLAQLATGGDSAWTLAAVVALVPVGPPELVPPRERAPPSGRGAADPLRLACEREIARFRGIELDGMGHGRATAMFDGPGRAVRFASAVIGRARALGVELAAGVCFDACHVGDADVEGAAVRLAPLVAKHAGAGEIVVTQTVKALLGGGGMRLAERGELAGGGPVYVVRMEG